jgi:hypothetical protein
MQRIAGELQLSAAMVQEPSLKLSSCLKSLLMLTVCLLTASTAMASAPVNRLQALLNDTAAQIRLAYRHDPDEYNRRAAELAGVVRAWRAAERNGTNNQLLAAWLRAAIATSMPGSTEPLPAVPKFLLSTKNVSQSADSALTKPAAAPSSKSNDDPFRDDPPSESK